MHRWSSSVVNKYFIVVFFCAVLSIGGGIGCAEETDLFLKIRPVEKEIRKEQPVRIEIRFESSNGNVKLYRHKIFGMAAALGNEDWLSLQIVSPSGELMEGYGAPIPEPKRPYQNDYVEVRQDSPYTEILEIYPDKYDTGKNWLSGIYRIKAVYSYVYKPPWKHGKDLWQGQVESNWIQVNIIGRNDDGSD